MSRKSEPRRSRFGSRWRLRRSRATAGDNSSWPRACLPSPPGEGWGVRVDYPQAPSPSLSRGRGEPIYEGKHRGAWPHGIASGVRWRSTRASTSPEAMVAFLDRFDVEPRRKLQSRNLVISGTTHTTRSAPSASEYGTPRQERARTQSESNGDRSAGPRDLTGCNCSQTSRIEYRATHGRRRRPSGVGGGVHS